MLVPYYTDYETKKFQGLLALSATGSSLIENQTSIKQETDQAIKQKLQVQVPDANVDKDKIISWHTSIANFLLVEQEHMNPSHACLALQLVTNNSVI
jgi:hypothetical protein